MADVMSHVGYIRGATLVKTKMVTSAQSDPIAQAMRELRVRLGLTQTELAVRIQTTQNTVLRYEGGMTRPIEALASYGSLALETGHLDLAALFRSALVEKIGSSVESLIGWQPATKTTQMRYTVSQDYREFVEELIDAVEHPRDDADRHLTGFVREHLRNRRLSRKGNGQKSKNS